jgi:putative N6-adenine-specific DNA methylase
MTQRYFATTAPGFEDQLADEIDGIGGRKLEKSTGGVEFDATHRVFYRANYELRCANRLYLRVEEFRARDFPELYKKVRRYSWDRLLSEENRVFIRGVARHSHLIHTDRIAETVGDGLREHFEKNLKRKAPEIVDTLDGNAQLVLARMSDDRCQLSLDSSGDHLFKRGWRQHAVEAPIRETLAAGLLMRAGWTQRKPLVDPMCGSGTFLVEGAWMASKRAPGDMREFAFQRWANYRESLWADVVKCGRRRSHTGEKVQFYGFDANPEAVEAAKKNVDLAGTSACTEIRQADVAELVPPCEERGMVIANPPYGERLAKGGGPRAVYETLIERFAEHFRGWRMGLILPSDITPSHDRLKFKEELRFQNGGIHVRFWLARHR